MYGAWQQCPSPLYRATPNWRFTLVSVAVTGEVPDRFWVDLADHDPHTSLSARHRIAVFYQGLVEALARRLKPRLPTWIADEELISSGQIGLMRAIDRFDPSEGTPFRRFASAYIYGSIHDELRRQDWAPRSLRQSQREVTKARRALTAEAHRRPTLQEIAEHLGWDEAKVEATLRKVEIASVVALQVHDQQEPEVADPSRGEDLDPLVYATFIEDFHGLPAAVQLVLARIYFLSETLGEVSQAMGLPIPVIRRLHMDGVRVALRSIRSSLLG